MNRLYIALAAFVVLGALSWATLSDPRLRFATLAVLAMFALKTWLRRNDVMHPDGGRESGAELSIKPSPVEDVAEG
jgi:hypothetical protein